MKKAALVCGAALLLFFGIWIVVFPETYLANLIENSLNDPEMRVEVSGLSKGLLYSFGAESITLKKADKTLIVAERIRGRINPFSLLLLRLDMRFSGGAGGGNINGRVDLIRGKSRVLVAVEKADLGSIPLFSLAGVNGSGAFSGRMEMNGSAGEIRFEITDARMENSSFGGIALPLNIFRSARGVLSVADKTVSVTSFALEGTDIFARIKGTITGSRLKLAMEVMPERSFMEKNPLAALLEAYKVSPGYYVIPVDGDLLF